MKQEKLYTPGMKSTSKGEYTEVGVRGGKIQDANHVTMESGKRFPPTGTKGHKWEKM